MNIFEIDTIAVNKLASTGTNSSAFIDPTFNEICDVVTGIFTAVGVFPTARAMLNGHLHKRFSAMLVTAFQLGKAIDIPTRKLSSFHDVGISTQYIRWLDHCVQEELLISHSEKAEGALRIGALLKSRMKPYYAEI